MINEKENDIILQNKVIHLKHAFGLYRDYQSSCNDQDSFYEWLHYNNILKDPYEPEKICDMFDVSIVYDMLGKEIESQTYTDVKPIHWNKIKKIMDSEGFIFV